MLTRDGGRAETHSVTVQLYRRPGALDRVVGLLRRHGCVLIELYFARSDDPDVDCAHVMFEGSSAARIAQHLSRLVDVIAAAANDHTSASSPTDAHRIPFHFQADGMSDGTHEEKRS
jgi:acetolactate synthase small subunit